MRADDLKHDAYTLGRLREATYDISDIAPLTATDEFQCSTAAWMVDKVLVTDSFTSRVQYNRTPTHIARGGLDHYQVALCLQGQMRFRSGRRELAMRSGDVCLIDMTQPSQTWLGEADGNHAQVVALVLPRTVLAPLLAHPDSVTASFLPGSERYGRLLASQFAAFWQPAEREASGLAATIEAIADVVAAAAGGAAAAKSNVGKAERYLLLAMIKRHIEVNLETELLTVDHLCRRFRISRASLYRLFEAEGGVAHYVQEQRLSRALRSLIYPAPRGKRLIDLAVDLQFSSDSTFIRAFRRQFGLTPGEIRDLSDTWLRETGAAPGSNLYHYLARRHPPNRA